MDGSSSGVQPPLSWNQLLLLKDSAWLWRLLAPPALPGASPSASPPAPTLPHYTALPGSTVASWGLALRLTHKAPSAPPLPQALIRSRCFLWPQWALRRVDTAVWGRPAQTEPKSRAQARAHISPGDEEPARCRQGLGRAGHTAPRPTFPCRLFQLQVHRVAPATALPLRTFQENGAKQPGGRAHPGGDSWA